MVATIVVVVIVAVGLFFGIRAIYQSTKGKSCCSDGEAGKKKVKKVKVTDTDETHYPYEEELLIGGMSCEGCAQNVANALNGVEGTWAEVDLSEHTARIRSKNPIDNDAYEAAVRDAGYYVMKL